MKRNKIMSCGNLEDIAARLEGCQALLSCLCESASLSVVSEASLMGLSDLLECIRRDFRADIDSAEDYTQEVAR